MFCSFDSFSLISMDRARGLGSILCFYVTMTPEVIAANRALGVESDEVVLAYCASGTRSTIAWALGQAGQMPGDEILAAAQAAGYDLGNLRPALDQPFA